MSRAPLAILDRLSQPIATLCLIAAETAPSVTRGYHVLPSEVATDAREAADAVGPIFAELRAAAWGPATRTASYTFQTLRAARLCAKAVVPAFPKDIFDTRITAGEDGSVLFNSVRLHDGAAVLTIVDAPEAVHAFCAGFLAATEVG